MDATLMNAYLAWRRGHDEGYCYDEIFTWVESQMNRASLLALLDEVTGFDEEPE
jgi:hypothetical protein